MTLPTVRTLEEMRNRCEVVPWSGCWIWMMGTDRGGYGRIMVDDKGRTTHRYAWTLAKGPIPAGLHVLHRCDVRCCVNPEHLWLGTNADNLRDAAAKGRLSRSRNVGERNHFSKLTADDVRFIRESKERNVTLAEMFQVDASAISNVRRRRNWAHL